MSALRQGVCKAMTESALLVLRMAGICTVTDFVSADLEDLSKTCAIPYKDLVSIRRVLLAQYSAFPVPALNLYNNALVDLAILPTGFPSLDKLLDGGLFVGEMCEVAGKTAVGKTQVCFRCAATVASSHSKLNIVYMDTSASFCAERLLDLFPGGDQYAEEFLSRIKYLAVNDVYSLFSALDMIATSLKSETSGLYCNVKLLVVDNIAAVFYPVLGGQQMDSLALLEQVGLRLKQLAVDFSFAVLVTNNLTHGLDGETKPSLGLLWAHMPHTRLILEHLPVTDSQRFIRQVTLVKSVRLKTPASAQIDLSTEPVNEKMMKSV